MSEPPPFPVFEGPQRVGVLFAQGDPVLGWATVFPHGLLFIADGVAKWSLYPWHTILRMEVQ